MAVELSIKRRMVENDGGGTLTDRMSSLPDSVLCHILSFLPTKTAVATMTLVSRRWRHLWKDLQVFDFSNHPFYYGQRPFNRFALYVNAVLALRRSRDIRRMNLYCYISSDDQKFHIDCVDMWVHAAIGPRLKTLYLSINGGQRLLLPTSILNCTNLVSLRLDGQIQMKVQHSSVHFPSLKWLTFDSDIVDSEVALLSGCPVLEFLNIRFDPTSLIEVPVPPSSESLQFTDDNFTWTYLEIYPDSPEETITVGILGNFQTAVESYRDVFSPHASEHGNPILELFRYDYAYEYGDMPIQLQRSASKWPLCTLDITYTVFCNLHNLKFILPCFNLNLLLNVLEECHMLQLLVIQIKKEEPSPLRTWEPHSTIVPKCLVSHLTYIHIEGYQGFEDDLAFAEYVLRNGLVLKTMLIFVDISMDITNKYRSLKRLTHIPKGSVTCELKFDAAVPL